MAEIVCPAVVTDIYLKNRISGPVEIRIHILDPEINPQDRVLNTGISLGNGEGCTVDIDDQVSVIIDEGKPSKIEAIACRSCVFTKARGAKPPLVCNIYRFNNPPKPL